MLSTKKLATETNNLYPLYLLMLSSLIDTINGFFHYSSINIPISMVFRFILLSVLIISIKHIRQWLYISLFFTGLLSSVLFKFIEFDIINVNLLVRSLLFILSIIYFLNLNDNQATTNLIKKIILFNLLVIFTNIALGLFHIGYTTYDGLPINNEGHGFGYKGFFVAGNEVGPFILLLFAYFITLNVSRMQDSLKHRIFAYSSLLFMSLLLGTKSIILGAAILIIIMELYLSHRKRHLIVAFSLFVIGLSILFNLNFFDQYIQRYTFILDRGGESDLIFSGRLSYLMDIWHYYIKHVTLGTFLFGTPLQIIKATGIKPFAEIDFFDLFIMEGIFTVTITYASLIFLIFKIWNAKTKQKKLKKILFATFMMLFIISCVAGHILTSGMLVSFLPLCLYIIKINARSNKNENLDC